MITTAADNFQDLPTSDAKTRRIGFSIIFVVFGIFGTWAALAPLDSAANAPGVVTVQTYRKTVQHLEGGIVKELLVHDGDTVKKGDPLIILDDSQVGAEYEMNRSQLVAAKATEARLRAERDGKATIDFGDALEPNTKRGQEAQLSETQIFNARRNSRMGEIAVLQERIGQLNEQIKGLGNMIGTKNNLGKSYGNEIGELRELLAQGFVDKQRMLEQERKLDGLKSEIADHNSTITKTRLQINETQLQIVQLTKDFNSDVAKQLADTQTKVYDLQERTAAYKDRMSRIVIRAPDDGMVIGMTVHTVGGIVRAATPLLDIVPSISDLIVEVHVLPVDIDRIGVGKTAKIRFSAFNSATTPEIEGVVTQVSADRLTDERTGNPYYLARLRVTEEGEKKLGDRKLVPGMPADALINTGSRTMLQYILQPARNAIAESLIEE
ncbi:HlyD family type I secretion periplasmic adaptor subunit [Pseudomonas sp. CDFA 602]|uniref:HlyD family type I secretion periplasmic adaptor subunit n=1 Tax=Pseudomonas californiensis TaxID=2829823 RepID=UPI001E3740E1|nr:HlyD family type I secretion periplasmic adaptor subunit [Pseudomonas californiensis]MCD5995579.1 HlyD family type I secretion periplasmic adaptor subunit [Pseudomonas californiensis]MCD6001173.1 HlyD family type I secretion periplasmic adaptor subunit [Pseudomonas californiensis]